ncbi:MAG: hypothetical protein GX801_10265 [Fibrobacter sp.]|nr:hypothetical protein [Fibrobacter sp.]
MNSYRHMVMLIFVSIVVLSCSTTPQKLLKADLVDFYEVDSMRIESEKDETGIITLMPQPKAIVYYFDSTKFIYESDFDYRRYSYRHGVDLDTTEFENNVRTVVSRLARPFVMVKRGEENELSAIFSYCDGAGYGMIDLKERKERHTNKKIFDLELNGYYPSNGFITFYVHRVIVRKIKLKKNLGVDLIFSKVPSKVCEQ